MAKQSARGTEATGSTNEPQALAALEAVLAHTFANRQYLLDALTHRSYAYEFAGPLVVSNERLEFLGDAVIALVASDLLFARYPAADEGTLTQYRAALVRASTLAKFADELRLGAYLRLGRGEEATGGRTRPLLLASAFEAVVGALYLDGELPDARRFLEPLLAGAIERISQNGGQRQIKDDKSLLQELAQGELGVTPRYRVVAESGPSHERTFEVEVLLGEVVAARGEGHSKRQAEQNAAHAALAQPGWCELAEARLHEAEERVGGGS
jgi:ribonuclease-3